MPRKPGGRMCGRFTLRSDPASVGTLFGLATVPQLVARYNIAPTQDVGCILPVDTEVRWVMARWGLFLRWQLGVPGVRPLINARSETITQKPSFRAAFQHRRCLVPCDGFFEWAALPDSQRKQPWLFTIGDGELSAFAGLYEVGERQDGEPVVSCCLLTTEANALVSPIHDRMPVLLQQDHYEEWLRGSPDSARRLLRPYPAQRMQRVPVGSAVGNSRHGAPDCVVPTGATIYGNSLTPRDPGSPQPSQE
jgi:putative SOS response-associated peptidase YedK